jgi:hypothetical protein
MPIAVSVQKTKYRLQHSHVIYIFRMLWEEQSSEGNIWKYVEEVTGGW